MQNKWVKITYEDGESVGFKQGLLTELGDFYKIQGDNVVTHIRKDKVIAIIEKTDKYTGGEGK